MATPGKMACDNASPIRLRRRKIKNTPNGPAAKDKATVAAKARRIKPNSTKGPNQKSQRAVTENPLHTNDAPSAGFPRSAPVESAPIQRPAPPIKPFAENVPAPFPNHARPQSRPCPADAIAARYPITVPKSLHPRQKKAHLATLPRPAVQPRAQTTHAVIAPLIKSQANDQQNPTNPPAATTAAPVYAVPRIKHERPPPETINPVQQNHKHSWESSNPSHDAEANKQSAYLVHG